MFSKESLHHAYFIEGERSAVLADLEVFLNEAFNIVRQGHPDVHYAEYESFGIDDGRGLQEMQTVRPLAGDRKIFIIAVDAMTSEAQNSLLKVFEEPTAGTHFFIISSSRRILLPTLRSRVIVVAHSSSKESSSSDDAQDARAFITMSLKDRLAFVASMIEEKDKALAEGFLLSLVAELRGNGLESATSPARLKAIKGTLSLVPYLKDRAPSVKLILERVALLDF
jgi:DNA polymerase III, delta subunit